jgi:hypothetical protein
MEFALDTIVRALQRKLPAGTPALHAARLIYDWEVDYIQYDTARRDSWFQFGVQSAHKTIRRRAGVCSDMSVLYCTIARRLGLQAQYAHVDVDYRGDRVEHACSVVALPDRALLVDVAYKQFDIAHRAYSIVEEDALTEPLPDAQQPKAPHAAQLRPQHYCPPTRPLGLRETAVACVLLLSTAYFLTGGEPFLKPKKCCEHAHPASPRQEGGKVRPQY